MNKIILSIFSAAYLAVVFPKCYFRHDDWHILANAIFRLRGNWRWAFSVDFYFGPDPMVWFFRPAFKGIALLFYDLFGLNHYLWLTSTFLMTLCSLVLLANLLTKLHSTSRLGQSLFLAMVTFLVPIHFGSLSWVGEGLMNSSVLLCMAAGLTCFSRFSESKLIRWNILGAAFYLLALGLKEISVIQIGLVSHVAWIKLHEGKWDVKFLLRALTPYFVITVSYLVWRLGFVPLNVEYQFDMQNMPRALTYFGPVILFPLFAASGLAFMSKEWKKFLGGLSLQIPIFLAILASIIPLLGTVFFSPGWLLISGVWSCFAATAALAKIKISERSVVAVGVAFAVVSLPFVLYRLHEANWWSWGSAGRSIMQQMVSAPSDTQRIEVYDRSSDSNFLSSFERVIGGPAALADMWEVIRGTKVAVTVLPMSKSQSNPKSKSQTLQIPYDI